MDRFLASYGESEYVVIDEIGMMEFYSEKFKNTMEMVIRSTKPVIATLSRRFVKRYKNKGKIHYLTRDNFEEVYSRILDEIRFT